MKKLIPILEWLPNYPKKFLKDDITAGLIVGVMLIPQGMAYAAIAGLPPQYGLYAALLPQIMYAIFGTSRQLSVGPVAMDSLLVVAGLSTLSMVGEQQYIMLAILLAFLVGVVQLSFGLFRLGFVVNFLSRPVINGFTSAVALIIGLNQLKDFTGIKIERSNQVHKIIEDMFMHLEQLHWLTFMIGLGGVITLKGIKKINKIQKWSIPGSLFVLMLGILSVYLLKLDQYGVRIVGNIPGGLPSFTLPNLENEFLSELIKLAIPLALIGFMEAISIGKAIQLRHKDYEINPNQELIALGFANISGSLFSSFPTTAGFSRTAVNDQSGAKSGIASFISAGFIAVVLLFLTPLFYYLPNAILATIIMVAVFGLVDFKYPVFLWKNKKHELLMLLITFVVTLTIGVQEGILAGVVLSLMLVIYLTTTPHYAELGYFPDTKEYRNVDRFKEVVTRDDILIVRYDASLYFGNLSHFQETLRNLVSQKKPFIKLLIVNGESINSVDASALGMLEQFVDELKNDDIQVYMTGVKGPVRDSFHKSGLMKNIGAENFFLDIQEAVDFYDQKSSYWMKKSNTYARQSNT